MAEIEGKTQAGDNDEQDGLEDLVQVFDTQDETEANIVKGLLESAGIEVNVDSLDVHQDLFPGVGGVVLRVRADQAGDARSLIQESRQAAEEGEETSAN